MSEHAATIASTASAASYSISASIVVGDWLSIVDHHTWLVGLFLGLITLTTNIVFKIMDRRKVVIK